MIGWMILEDDGSRMVGEDGSRMSDLADDPTSWQEILYTWVSFVGRSAGRLGVRLEDWGVRLEDWEVRFGSLGPPTPLRGGVGDPRSPNLTSQSSNLTPQSSNLTPSLPAFPPSSLTHG